MVTLFYQYRRSILAVLLSLFVLGCATGGYYYMRHRQRETYLRNASYHYEQLMQHIAQNTTEIPLEKVRIFVEQYSNSPYPGLLQLELAQYKIQQNKLEEASELLSAAAKSTTDSDIRCIAIQRHARILFELGKTSEALHILDAIHEAAYRFSTEEIKGDILNASGDKEKALQAYRKAEQSDRQLAAVKPLLHIKINELKHLEKPDSTQP